MDDRGARWLQSLFNSATDSRAATDAIDAADLSYSPDIRSAVGVDPLQSAHGLFQIVTVKQEDLDGFFVPTPPIPL